MRYAIYYTTTAEDPLTSLAARWLGRDAFDNRMIVQPSVPGLDPAEQQAMTQDPRRYGFHATLKAPFELAGEQTEDGLLRRLDSFAASTPAFVLPELVLGRLGPFFALVPSTRFPELYQLADACVRQFEPFRAPLSDADLLRRRPDQLDPSLRQNLQQWGYPYIFDAFRFHMTLTGPIAADRQDAVQACLEDYFKSHIGKPLEIKHLSVFVEPMPGASFIMRKIVPLAARKPGETDR